LGSIIVKTTNGGELTSTKNINLEPSIEIYPNPFTDFVLLKSKNDEKLESIQFFDSNGNEIKILQNLSVNEKINLSNLESGVYYMRVQTKKETILSKIIKI
jgi:serine protease AprX